MSDTIPLRDPQSNLPPETTFIYVLIDPDTNEVRYVGKSNNPHDRYRRHLRKDKDTYRAHWVNNLKSRGLKPILQIIEETPFEQWEDRERYWIAFYRQQGSPLTNTRPGGNGGAYNSVDVRARISAFFKGRPSPLRGVKRPPYSAEWRAKIGVGNKGKKRTPEQRANSSEIQRGHPTSPETRAKISVAHKGRKHSPETRAKLSEARRRRVLTSETREKLSIAGKKNHPKGMPVCPTQDLSPETRAKISAASKGRKHPPRSVETREKLRKANTGKSPSPESRVKLSASQKGRVKSPEERKHISESKKGVKRKPFTAEARANMGLATRRRNAMKKLPPSDAPTLWG